jgi:hypothetical protein
MAAKKQSLTVKLQSMEVGEEARVTYGYMTTMVTISRMKKTFGNNDKKFLVEEIEEKVSSVKRLK